MSDEEELARSTSEAIEEAPGKAPSAPARSKISRRALLLGTGAAAGALGATGVYAMTASGSPATPPPSAPLSGTPVIATGAHQAGVGRPAIPQQHCVVAVGALDTQDLEASLVALGERITHLTNANTREPALFPDGAGDLTVTVGLGSRALMATRHPNLTEAVSIPEFQGDAALPSERRAGDIYLSINASNPGVLEPALARLTGSVVGYRELWSDYCFRPPSSDDVSRNPLGYHDGIIVPRTKDELAENVWIQDGPLAGGTICVTRRFALDTVRFRGLSGEGRDAVIGRHQATGVPLSGGKRSDPVNLTAKADNGELIVPAHAHARAAHPSFTGSKLMLRRSYGFRASESDQGLLFISFQGDVATFTRTQLRLDEMDDLMGFATPTATGAFAILPGIEAGVPLGASLFT